MPQRFGQAYNKFPVTQCPELPDPCSSPVSSRRQTQGQQNCPPETGRQGYDQGMSRRETFDTRPLTRRETYPAPCTPIRGRETYEMPQRRDDIVVGSRGTYGVPTRAKRGTYGLPEGAKRGTYGLPHTPRQGTYTPAGSGSPEIAPQYLATMCPDAEVDEERRRLKEDFRSMQSTPWTMGESVTTPPWGEGVPPRGGTTPGDTMGGLLADYPMREGAPWDRDCDVFSSPDTAVSLSHVSKRGRPPSPMSASPQPAGGWSPPSPPCPTHSPPSPATAFYLPTPRRHPDSDSYPESYSPEPRPAPKRGRSPAPSRSGRTLSPSGHGSRPCSSPAEVSSGYPSTGSPGSIDTGLSSPGTPSRSCPDGTNLVKPTLEDMLCTINFGAKDFVTDRMQHINDINQVIMAAVEAIRTAQAKMADFERVMDNGTTMITPFVNYWGDVAEHYVKQNYYCTDPNRPIPNLNINHPSKQVNQAAFCELLSQMAVASQAAERGVRSQDLEYGELDEQLSQIKDWLRSSVDGFVCHIEKNANINDKFLQILTNFNERRRRVLAFLEEWQCGGEELNEPPLSPTDRPRPPAIPPITSPGSTVTSPSSGSPCSEATTPVSRQEGAVDRLRERAQALQDMVRRFNDMQSHAMHEVRNIQTQNMMLEQSLNAMENVRFPPSS